MPIVIAEVDTIVYYCWKTKKWPSGGGYKKLLRNLHILKYSHNGTQMAILIDEWSVWAVKKFNWLVPMTEDVAGYKKLLRNLHILKYFNYGITNGYFNRQVKCLSCKEM
jgi:hypothetical protein